jgi:predicted Ser/Thr protein kinase
MGTEGVQELTTTATGSAASPGPLGTLGATLGRYRLEHVLGTGAIGVVHAAFDCDLQRRVALKVLRAVAATAEAKDRLLREARAMARLAHPNVVAVYEVGSFEGRDFIAMELVHGEPLVQWLRAARRSMDAILDAFLAAGRGLAAAHAAGIVHRDFKPHNVLRSHDGRIAVTDFGLARTAEPGASVAFETTQPYDARPPVRTATGALLGTPAYMAPEQWDGGAVTPATDQFAFCVALWEALAGERPFTGQSARDLRHLAARGPTAYAASKLPRRVRRLLCRGLDPDPRRRWPSMDALLEDLATTNRRKRRGIASAGAVAATAAFVALRSTGAPSDCTPPARAPSTIWSAWTAAEVETEMSSAHAAVFDAAHHEWLDTRRRACEVSPALRPAQLACLDRVLERFDAVRRGYQHAPSAPEDVRAQLIDPDLCNRPTVAEVPRLTVVASPSVVAAFALLARSETSHKPRDAEIGALLGDRDADPCARVIHALAYEASSSDVQRKRAVMMAARAADDECADQRLHADLLIRSLPYQLELPVIGPRGEAAIAQAAAAVHAVTQPDLTAAVAQYRAIVAHQHAAWGVALREVDEELAGYRARGMAGGQVFAVLMRNHLRLGRGTLADLEAAARDAELWRAFALGYPGPEISGSLDVRPWRPAALASHRAELVRQLDASAALARYRLGDPAARGDLVRAWHAQPDSQDPPRMVEGSVVDIAGRPVADALVATSNRLLADEGGLGLPSLDSYDDYRDLDLHTATTDAAGRFRIATSSGMIAAERSSQRSAATAATDGVRLVLRPSRTLSGRIDLGGVPYTLARVTAIPADQSAGVTSLASIAPDGSFEIAGAPVGPLRLMLSVQQGFEYDLRLTLQRVPAGPHPVRGLRFIVPSSDRNLDVIVRSTVETPLDGARVAVLEGHHEVRSVLDLMRIPVVHMRLHAATPAAATFAAQVHPGDLVSHVQQVPSGELTVCASSFQGDPLEPSSVAEGVSRFTQLAIRCATASADASVVEIAVPPQPRTGESSAAQPR